MKKPILLFLMLITVLGIGYVTSFLLMDVTSGSESVGRKAPEFRKDGELIFKKANDSTFQKKIDFEMADEGWEIKQGLMYRISMGESEGMVFKMPTEKLQSFWMKNTNISLDIIYLNANKKIVSIQKYASPHSEELLDSKSPAQ
ncbi:MAG: uncharacterized membrane protein (UPF0127 family), partial [Bacteroidia bacterium]